ncbi:dihydroneopterin aldolase [Sphingomonas sp. MS122]|uniref:dihydroneopterin aldolase n=1 Tax=Sphingomonas sp. MS122 TaxID=3412683 RepID=UPI003C2E8CC4
MASDRPFPGQAIRAARASGLAIEVTISDLQVTADIGVYAHEHGRPQPLVVDIILNIDAPACDALEETIDYQHVADDAHALARGRTALIETYAMRLAERCIACPRVQRVEVRVSKPGALRGGLAGARASLVRSAA